MNAPIPAADSRRTLLSVIVAALALVTAGACAEDRSEVPVRTTSPAGSWTAPSARQAADRDRALVRVVAAIPGESRLDLFAENQKIAQGLEYKTITPYMEVSSGRRALLLRPAGMDTADPLAEETARFQAGEHYTIVVMPGEGDGAAAVRIFEDTMEAPEEGRAKLRTVHAAGDAGRIDVHMEGRMDPLAGGLEFQRASDFTPLQPPAGAIELRPAGRTEKMLRLADLRLTAGGLYTIVLIGRTRTEPPLETLVLEDRTAEL